MPLPDLLAWGYPMYEEKLLRFMTCGGVTQLDTTEFEEELEAGAPWGPKLGEAGTDESNPWED